MQNGNWQSRPAVMEENMAKKMKNDGWLDRKMEKHPILKLIVKVVLTPFWPLAGVAVRFQTGNIEWKCIGVVFMFVTPWWILNYDVVWYVSVPLVIIDILAWLFAVFILILKYRTWRRKSKKRSK